MNKRTVAVLLLALSAGTAASVRAQVPPMALPMPGTVNPYRHGNLAEAQRAVTNAYYAVIAAQQYNGYQLGGHGDRARALLYEANQELLAAARTSNRNGH